ncbi:MAG: hypothetical protein ACYTG0_15965 [Planctomycetota bacterium]
MIETASLRSPVGQIQYAGVDLFEARSSRDGPGMMLKTAHRLLTRTGARIQLVPGDPFSALSRAANRLAGTELVVISARQDIHSLARAWFFLPRMLAPGAEVWAEKMSRPEGRLVLRQLAAEEIAELSAAAAMARAA